MRSKFTLKKFVFTNLTEAKLAGLALFASIFHLGLLGQNTVTYTSSGNYTVPSNVELITVQCWGAGGGGASRSSNGGGGGGGGGAFACSTLTVVPGNIFDVVPGASGTSAIAGGNSFFGANLVLAGGGNGALNNSSTGAAGGNASNSIGFITYSGGNGGTSSGNGAGGGGAAGILGNGAAGSNNGGGTGNGLNSGNGANRRTGNGFGNNGFNYGGGGGGARRTSGSHNGGNGGAGLVTVTPTLWANPITGSNPGLESPYTTGQIHDSRVNVSGISAGSGLIGVTGVSRYNQRNFTTANSIDLNDYFELSITPAPGYQLNLNSLVYTGLRSSTGPTNFAVRSSVNNFTTNFGSPNATGGNISLTGAVFQGITQTVTFRIYGWQASSASGTFSVNDFFLHGSVQLAPYIASFNPTEACVGETVTISGLNFTNVNTVKVNGLTTTFNVINSSTIETVVPAGATTGALAVSTADGTVFSSSNLTVPPVPAQPGSFTSSQTNVCAGSTGIAYTVPSVAGVTYTWAYSGTGVSISGSGNSVTLNFASNATSGNLSVTPGTSCGSGSPRTIAVNVQPVPVALITPTYCQAGGNVTLTASGGTSYLWSNGATSNAIVVDQAGFYSVTVSNSIGCSDDTSFNLATELVTNGGFSAGNTGFTTAYSYRANIAGQTELYPEGTYAIVNDANLVHTAFRGRDRYNSGGNIMVINGHPDLGMNIWSQNNIAVEPNTTYYFSAWAMSVVNGNNAVLQFSINGNQVGTIAYLPNGYTNANGPYNWVRFYGTWNSGSETEADISIINLNTVLGGNDFALDDISFATLSPVELSITPAANSNLSVCEGSPVFLTANTVGGSSPYTFAWTGPNGFSSAQANPTVTSSAGTAINGSYQLTVTDAFGCSVTESVVVNVISLPADKAITLSDPAVCSGGNSSVVVENSEAGVYYQMFRTSNGSAASGIVNGTGSNINLSTIGIDGSTSYFILATRAMSGCSRQLTTTINFNVVQTPELLVTNQAACSGTVNLTAAQVTAGSSNLGSMSYYTLNTGVQVYNENFNGQTNAGVSGPGTSYNTGSVSWTIDASSSLMQNTSDYVKVVSDRLEARDTEGDIVWYSPVVSLNGYTNVSFSLSATEAGTLENTDYLFTEYSVNGGPWTFATNNGSLIDDFSSVTVSSQIGDANTLQIRVTFNCNADDEYLRIDNVVISGSQYVPVANPAAVSTGVYHIESNNSGCSSIEPVSVVVSSSPSATFSYSGSPFCSTAANPTPTITGSAGVFSSTTGLVFVSTSTGEINLAASTPGTYTITNTVSPTGVCSPVTHQQNIVISASPIASFNYGSNSLCQTINAAPVLPDLDAGASAGTFTRSSTLLSLNSSTGAINVTASVPGNYAVINTLPAAAGCSIVRDTTYITINPYTFEGAINNSVSANEICLGENAQLFASGTSYQSVALQEKFNGSFNNWSVINNSLGGTVSMGAWTQRNNNYNNDVSFRSNDNSSMYIVHSRDQNGLITSSILQSPAVSAVGYSDLQLEFWHYFRFQNQPGEVAKVEISTDGANWALLAAYTSTQGNSTNFSNVSINLNAYAGFPQIYIRFNYYSEGRARYWAVDNVTLSGTSINYNYAWTSDPSGYNSFEQNPVFAPTNNAFYILNAENTYGCSITKSPLPISVKPVGELTSTLTPAPVCSGSPFHYIPAISLPTATYQWTRPSVAGISNSEVAIPQNGEPSESLENTTSSSINVLYIFETSYEGCTKTEQVNVTVHPSPQADAGTDVTICASDSIQLNASASGGFGTLNYTWLPDAGLNDASLLQPWAQATADTVIYKLLVSDQNGCNSSQDSIRVIFNGHSGAAGLWTGISNTDWTSCLNWADGRVPHNLTDVIIRDDYVNAPQLSGIIEIHSLTIESSLSNPVNVFIDGGTQVYVEEDVFINKLSGTDSLSLIINDFGQLHCRNLTVAGSAPQETDSRLLVQSQNALLNVEGDMNVTAGGYLQLGDLNPATTDITMQLGGDLTLNVEPSAVAADMSVIQFNGNADQELNLFEDIQLSRLRLSKPSGNVILNNSLQLVNGITLEQGLLHLNNNELVLGNATTGATVNGGSDASYILAWTTSQNGAVTHHVPQTGRSYNFPVGDLTDFTPFEVILDQADLNAASIQLSLMKEASPNLAGDETIFLNRYWIVEPQGITSPLYSVEYKFAAADVNGPAGLLFPAKYNAGGWQSCIESASNAMIGNGSVNTGTNTLTWSGITSFSEFTAIGNGTALPVELLLFNAEAKEKHVDLIWTTASEINNSHFIIERSKNTIQTEEVARVNGSGNSTTIKNYSSKDENPMEGISYYRLKQVDYNGDFSYSDWVAVNYAGDERVDIEAVYVAKGSGELIVKCSNPVAGQADFQIFDTGGKLIQSYLPGAISANWSGSIPLRSAASGSYILRFTANGQSAFKKFVVH